VDASVTAIAEERATANQRAAFCFGLVLIIIFGIIIRLLAVKMAEDETVTVSLK
jgi:t-SNARE complex subunit (syntaxin)